MITPRARKSAALLAVIGSWAHHADSGEVPLDLQSRVENASKTPLSSEDFKTLTTEVIQSAKDSTSRSKFWRALRWSAALCQSGHPNAVRDVRRKSLTLLAERDSDTLRWSTLISRQFVPAFGAIPKEEWSDELRAYDEILDKLAEPPTCNDRVLAEILHAKAYARVFISQRYLGLSENERLHALDILRELKRSFGPNALPGAKDASHGSCDSLADRYIHELTALPFGGPAPETIGVDLDGKRIDLHDYGGQVVVLDFWTSFCQPCLALVPGVRAMLDDLEGEPVVYIGICGDTTREQGEATAERVGMTWRNLWDGQDGTDGPTAQAWNVGEMGWPSVFVLDGEGKIRSKLCGKDRIEDELPGVIQALLKEG